MRRFEEWRANPTAAQFQTAVAPASYSRPQPLVARPGTQSRGANTPTSSSTPSSSRSRASVPPRSRTPSPYRQGSYEEDRAWREREDAMLRDETRRREEASFVDEMRFDQLRLTHEDDTRRHREREEEGRRRITEQRRQEQDGILRRQQEADYAAQSARLGQPTGQNQSVTIPQAAPISTSLSAPAVQYPSASGPPAAALASSGPITKYLQMPLESPTRYVKN
jgi:STAM-binding protein